MEMVPRPKLQNKWQYLALALLIVVVLGGLVSLVFTTDSAQGNLQWEKKKSDFWQLQRTDRRYWHEDAERYCRQLTLDKHYDWRLPTVEELSSLAQLSDGKRGKLARVQRAIYWSSTPDKDKRRYRAFSFLTGKSAPMATHNYNSVVCVRTIE